MNNISIFISTHKDFNEYIYPLNDMYTILSQQNIFFDHNSIYLNDEFTNKYNILYSEGCSLYYLYKNPSLINDYIVHFHYRRYFENFLNNENDIIDYINKYGCVVCEPWIHENGNLNSLYNDFGKTEVNKLLSILDKYKEYKHAIDFWKTSKYHNCYNIFAMKKNDFLEMCHFCFEVLEIYCKMNNFNSNSDVDNLNIKCEWLDKRRICAYFLECLTNIFYLYKFGTDLYTRKIIYTEPFNDDNNIKCCVLSLQKKNDKLNEWINYYLNKLKFNHIFLIDNNDIAERISNNIDNVTIIPFNDISFKNKSFWMQNVSYKYAFNYIRELDYDYIFVCDSDEFLLLKQHNNIQNFIKDQIINKGLNWLEIYWDVYDDNDIIYLKDEKETLLSTYTRQQSVCKPFDNEHNECSQVKSIYKITNELDFSNCAHKLNNELINKGLYNKEQKCDPDVAVINHYRTRCLEWYLQTKVKELYFSIITDWYCTDALEGYALFNHITSYKLEKFFEIYKNIFGEEYKNKKYIYDKYNQ